MPSALVFLAEGAEEMETVIVVDVLRRAGVNIFVLMQKRHGGIAASVFIMQWIFHIPPPSSNLIG